MLYPETKGEVEVAMWSFMLVQVRPIGGENRKFTAAELRYASSIHTMYWYKSALPWSGDEKGLSQAIENG